MPGHPAKPCTYPGCGALVRDGTARCPRHIVQAWRTDVAPPDRIRGRRGVELRKSLFKREPLCRECKALGIVMLATQRDHIVSLREGGKDTEDNVQPLCEAHHEERSLAEALRGRARG